MHKPSETPLAATLPSTVPFVGPEALERTRGRGFVARIGANESVFGPSPKVIEAITRAAPEAWMYGDPENHDLRNALAAFHGVDPGEVVVGEGIDALLGYVVRLYAGPGDHVVTSDGAYPTFNYHVAGYGASLTKVPYRDDKEDPEALLKAASDVGAKMIYLANPDNPMGSWHRAGVIDDMIADLPQGCLLVLDEAYVEFAPDGAVPQIDPSNPQVLRMRTFSKAHGLAGMRAGYAIGEAGVIRNFEKIRNHFGLSRVTQAAAMAALADTEWLDTVKREVSAARERIAEIAAENGLTALPSATNFVTIDCGRDADFAKAVLNQLIERDIFVRMPFAAPGNRCIRISCGTVADLDRLAEALPLALRAAADT
ncbi:MAG: pyridoxal phosphate-dependent aminotransferase [Rhodobacteraceae bacterium]|nr:MAG: pyridoxal phosphate-dependent aminotransferase [Paracoccaceae bacterium]